MPEIPWTKLPMHFDPAGLRADLESISPEAWKMHFNSADFDGSWSGVSLRSTSGRVDDIVPGTAGPSAYVDTPLMERCFNLRAAVAAFRMPLKSVRLLRLHAGSQVKEHRDRDLGLKDGEVRIHVPVITSEQVEFIVAGRQLRLRAGEAWYVDFSQPHRIDNAGTDDRVHLILDGELNDWARNLLARSAREIATESSEPAGLTAWRSFEKRVFADPALASRLRHAGQAGDLLLETVAAGRELGFAFKLADVESVYHRNREEWILRTAAL